MYSETDKLSQKVINEYALKCDDIKLSELDINQYKNFQ